MAEMPDPKYIRGIVDMGSNGIRLSLTSLAPPLTRTLPTLYQSRIPVSLYDAQYPLGSTSRQPIPSDTTASVIKQLLRFKRTCISFGCKDENVSILATEAARTAVNSKEYIAQIENATGWKVSLLAKEDEGRIGASGVASSLGHVEGLVMDLGGGSTQLSHLTRSPDGRISLPDKGAISLPYGAAALTRRIKEAQSSPNATQALATLQAEVTQSLHQAVAHLSLPTTLQTNPDGIPLYLSGGGFRGWGYALMSTHQTHPYPIPIINGFSAPRSSFLDTTAIQTLINPSLSSPSPDQQPEQGQKIFRIAPRRASQIPAVSLLIRSLALTLPQISTATFCQGGVREGHLFADLPLVVQREAPLVVATAPFARGDPALLTSLLLTALPAGVVDGGREKGAGLLGREVVQAFAQTLYVHAGQVKDIRPSSALRFSSTGELAGTHGLGHGERAMLGVLLCERWGGVGELADTDRGFYERLSELVPGGGEGRWWLRYLGRIGGLVGVVWPAGIREGSGEVGAGVETMGRWERREGKGDRVVLTISVKGTEEEAREWKGEFEDEIEDVVKVGKKKNWVGGREGVGYKVEVEVVAA
ncbi:Ppx/GppA phosphatase family-domain-containing protein [Elsinoe ampelina]|uniref:Ppx/GppA phosphatase family-domain-containing protein n=1 Tax=Elsinoe ampelina TaxID=302913 RepID=A0A6A6GQ14_9PEZI|nr:Ppx/GppA phosphatase family-domain-containing protein [Elsinoe ampelina]